MDAGCASWQWQPLPDTCGGHLSRCKQCVRQAQQSQPTGCAWPRQRIQVCSSNSMVSRDDVALCCLCFYFLAFSSNCSCLASLQNKLWLYSRLKNVQTKLWWHSSLVALLKVVQDTLGHTLLGCCIHPMNNALLPRSAISCMHPSIRLFSTGVEKLTHSCNAELM